MATHPSQNLFFETNPDIKWMPLILSNKNPVGINHECFKRLKITDGTITYTPNYTEFKTISKTTLTERQTLFGCLPYKGIDTYDIAQIDIDTPNVNKEWLNSILKETPYYKSLTKEYGYHIFVRITDDFKPTKVSYHFKAVLPPNDEFNETEGFRLCPDADEKKVELLTGKWGYINSTTEIHNADKPILSITNITNCLVNYTQTKNTIIKSDPPPPYKEVEETEENHEYIKDEINDHMLNIKQSFIDNYSDHLKIIIAILKTGYEDIAYNCMFKSSNTKNKNLDAEFEKFKNAKLYDITPATLFHYSKASNPEQFFKINQKYQYYQLRKQAKVFFFNLNNITKTINKKYLPKNLINEYLNNKQNAIIHIQSPMGTGKTSMIKYFLDEHKNESVLYISPRRTFSNDVYSDLIHCEFNHYQYLTKYKEKNNDEIPKRIICQVESLYKLKNQKYDIVIIDEIESDLSQLVSPTNKNFISNHYLFERFIRDAKKVITMDAFLTNNSQKVINEIKPNTHTYTIQNIYKSKQKWTAYEIGKLKQLQNQALADIDDGKKIVFISSIKKVAYNFVKKLPDGCKYKFYSGDSGDAEKKFNNIKEEWGNIDVLVYTGVITCGVSFDPEMPYFDSIYCYVSPSGSSARDIQQAKERVRHFKTNNLYFCVDKTSYAFDYHKFYANSYDELEQHEKECLKEKRECVKTTNNTVKVKAKEQSLNEEENEDTKPNGLDRWGFKPNNKKEKVKEQDKTENTFLNGMPEWAFKNYMFSVYTKQINTLFQLALFCEYLRFQGYKIIYADYSNGDILDGAKYIHSCNVYEPSNMTANDYEELQKRCYDLTEEEKLKIKHYLFEVRMGDIIKGQDIETVSILYKHFNTSENMGLFNVMFRPDVYDFELNNDYENDEKFVNLNTSIDKKKYFKINELCNILGCRKIYELDYTTDTLTEKAKPIMKWINDNKHFFNFRDTRGETSCKYINAVIRKVSEYVGLRVEAFKSSKLINNEKVNIYKYSNYKNKKGECVKLYEIYKGLEK